MDVSGRLREVAKELVGGLQGKILALQKEIGDLQAETRKKQASLDTARSAAQRLFNYDPVFGGNIYHCPRCWIIDEARSPLRPISGGADYDSFTCEMCHEDYPITI